ncbi:MAG: cysteine desulfurase [Candidatus Marinimicrobia bacterium]|jgi:cysteine desulfurase NifS|nr:cysteine desulfurase [Candidatus Neomarinimicrobiota bacterium]MBT3632024.1 cysteine desulfurase [Candidatus Neomarinimicrobiota bacterium]MBT3824610.1 cysteine desulfurase [Candidatus Neomarinimicrobiota bacterium]MBT4130216.1 cysteine desulfurase [Candidatus Neomarinimicrobiota bacterium]MBT4296966.1 cysteine desulfurase [Candidatus Neomarinimicrobiota bacterium]
MLLDDGKIYLDYNATTPIDPMVQEAMEPFYRSHFGNPSSNHSLGRYNRQAIDFAREQVASLLGTQPEEVIFTSGGSESNNMALKGIASRAAVKGQHIIVSKVEHPAILNVVQYLQHQGFRISFLPVDSQGVVQPDDLDEIITSKTILVSVMHANNEIGSIQPIDELTEIAHRAGATFHTDAAQSVGKIPVDVNDLGCDLLSVAGHKLYAPKGVGVLYKKTGIDLEPLLHGADHENGMRAGTENVAQIVGLGMAAEIASQKLESEMLRLKNLRDRLQASLKQAFPEIRINAVSTPRLPNTLSVSFAQLNALDILANLEEVMISAGAACHSGDGKGSGVLEAMHIPLNYQLGTIRISLGRFCDESIVQQASAILIQRITRLLES